MAPATIEFLWPERLTDDEMKSLMVSIEESRSAFTRQYFDAMADQVDRELMAANKSALPIMIEMRQSNAAGAGRWEKALREFHEAVKLAEHSLGAINMVWAEMTWSEARIRRRKRHARYRRGREKVRPRHRRQRRS